MPLFEVAIIQKPTKKELGERFWSLFGTRVTGQLHKVLGAAGGEAKT